jgi:hypothetical protein
MKGRNQLPLALSATPGTAGIACADDDQPIAAEEIAVRNAGGPGEMEFDRYVLRRNPRKPIVKLRRVIPLRCDDLRARSHSSPPAVRTPEGQSNPHQRTAP